MSRRVMAEWEAQEGVIVAFPHEETDWSDYLEDARSCVVQIVTNIALYEKVYLLCGDEVSCRSYFSVTENITFICVPFNDTWMRDCNVLSCLADGKVLYKGFEFTGWGGKFSADLDNQLTSRLASLGVYPQETFEAVDYILEGGAVESDGQGSILTTTSCLLNANRNAKHDKNSVENVLKKELGAKRVLWLDHGKLVGDDTDGHIDTLARFCDAQTIAYVGLPPVDDEHYQDFKLMKEALESFRDKDENPYRLVALPFVPAIYYEGDRLPATYANFLIINGAVLVPTYGVSTDTEALEILQECFKEREVIGIDCQVLIKEHGSLHCITMQLAKATF